MINNSFVNTSSKNVSQNHIFYRSTYTIYVNTIIVFSIKGMEKDRWSEMV